MPRLHAFFSQRYGWAVRSRLDPVKKVAGMLTRHLDGVLRFVKHPITNCVAEEQQDPEHQAESRRLPQPVELHDGPLLPLWRSGSLSTLIPEEAKFLQLLDPRNAGESGNQGLFVRIAPDAQSPKPDALNC